MGRFSCVVFNCKMRTSSTTPEQKKLSESEYLVSFNKFPSDLTRQKLWTKALGNEDWVPNDDSVVCSLHFGADCYDENHKLLDTAVPSILFDNFEDHLKLILDAIEKEKIGEINFDDQNTSNNESTAAKEEKADGFSSDDSDFEIECEEILISDESDEENADVGKSSTSITPESVAKSSAKLPEPPSSKSVSAKPVTCKTVPKPTAKATNSSANTSTSSTKTTPVSSASKSILATKPTAGASRTSKFIEVTIDDDDVSTSNDSTKDTTVSSKHDATNSAEPAIPKLHNIPINEDTSEQARQLYSMIQSGSFQNFPVMQPASKNLVRQLLDIVKLANSRNQSSGNGEENIPNTYIITTKYDDPNSTANVKLVETTDVISMVTQTVQAIKDGTYEKCDDVVIICGSPAIFLIKNVSVKTFDPNMNSVYVITSENLISYLYLLSTKVKPICKNPVKSTEPAPSSALKTALKNQKIPFSSLATKIIPQKLLSSLPSNVQPIASSSTLPAKSSVTVSPAAQQTPITPVTVASLLSAAEITRPVQSLPVSAITKSVPLIVTSDITKNADNVTSSPITSSSPTTSTSLLIPSKSSAFQSPKVALAPLSAMRNNMANLKRKIIEMHTPEGAPVRGSSLPAKRLPSLVVPRFPVTSNVTLTRPGGATLNKTGFVKLTFSPASSAISTPKVPLKPLQPSDKPQFIRLEPSKVGLKFDSVALKRNLIDPVVDSNAKRIGIENKISIDNSSKSTPTIAKPISPIRNDSPEAPSPMDNSDSEEDRPLSPRAAQRLLATQRTQMRTLEQNIVKKERDILALRKKAQSLKKRCLAAKKTADSKPDEQLVEDILKKYLDNDAVQFFVGQMKMAGKTFTQFRWTEEDKLFALGLLYRNPVEYHVLVRRFTLPSDKTLNKFVTRIKKAEMDANVTV